MLAQMLDGCGQKTIACGNIGKPLSEVAREKIKYDVLTVEVSSFQLETTQTFRPSIALWLNFAPDHLDRYRSVAEYRAAKLRLFEKQTADDVAIVNAVESLPDLRARKITFSAYTNRADFRLAEGAIVFENKPVLRLNQTKLRGSHNIAETSDIPYDVLEETHQQHLRLATLQAANDRISNFIAGLGIFPLYSFNPEILYGGVDGQKFESPTNRDRTGANSSGKSAGSITSTTPRRPISMPSRKLCSPKANRSFSSPGEKTKASLLNRSANW